MIMIVWKDLWLMIQFGIMWMILHAVIYLEKLSGNLLSSSIRLIKLYFVQKML